MQSDGLVAVVTGASSGIGAAIAQELSKDYHVVGICRSRPASFIEWVEADLSEPYLPEWFDSVDVLVNNAGAMVFDSQMDYQEAEGLFRLNVLMPWALSIELAERMSAFGSIINIASVSGLSACSEAIVYGMTKAAVISLTKSLALRLASRGIRVNCISPGFIKTNLVSGDTPQELIDGIPLQYEAEPEVIARTVRWILDTPYLMGANIVVDGGVSLHDA